MNNNQFVAIKGRILVMLMFAAVAGVGILAGGAFAAAPVDMSSYKNVGNGSQSIASQAAKPLESLLNDDGTLKLSAGFSGSVSVDPKGWRMQTSPNGQPRFVKSGEQQQEQQQQHPPAKPRSTTSSPSSPSPLASGDENWDDRFGTLGMDDTV